ncbi:MerR family transcriptional regulator [Rhodovulum sp. DZ06]|uniref:MerR family transcriptional regulator n=1 Tax=Rhodovulum sp. DZ06 TaxID=3425126 RepID=UPI003D33DDEE
MVKSPDAFRTISEVSDALDVPAHVLRFWETKFTQVKPVKRGGGRRYYRPEDVNLLTGIRDLLYVDGLTIKGVQKVLRERGVRHVAGRAQGVQPPETAAPEAAAPTAPKQTAPKQTAPKRPARRPDAPQGADLDAAQAGDEAQDDAGAPIPVPTLQSAPPGAKGGAGGAADGPDAAAQAPAEAALRGALRETLERLESLHARLCADPSEGMEDVDCAAPARRRAAGGAGKRRAG